MAENLRFGVVSMFTCPENNTLQMIFLVCLSVLFFFFSPRTSVVHCLLPQDPLQVPGPGLLQLPAACLKRVRVLGFPLAEPDLKAQAAVAAVLGQANI